MWPFKTKKIETLQLPPLPSKFNDDISLLPEEIPEEIPPLEELNANQQPSSNMEEESILETSISGQPIVAAKKQSFMLPSGERFIMMDKYKETLTQLVSTNEELSNVDSEFSKIMKLKEEKDSKVQALQNSLEETSKKMMFMENTLFGG